MKSADSCPALAEPPASSLPEVGNGRAAEILQAQAVAVYATDAAGKITYFNDAAVELWGYRPELGEAEFCGSWRLFWPDGTALPHDRSPMALALKQKRAIRGMAAILERPDGSRVPFMPHPVPLFDAGGALTGAVNTLVDVSDYQQFERATHRLAAIVESADDAIVAKDLDGIITDWNPGAEQLFGYAADEAIGQPITIIIPEERRSEETEILARIRAGQRTERLETMRRRKNGSLIPVSLTISPVLDHAGHVVGASKIARDISERRMAEAQQALLLREMSHRVKNVFALAGAVITLSVRSASSARELATAVRGRLGALARVNDLTLEDAAPGRASTDTTLPDLVRAILAPYGGDGERVSLQGPDITVKGHAVTSLAMLLHELATNAAKYGALAGDQGRIDVTWSQPDDQLHLEWSEHEVPGNLAPPQATGFGTYMCDSAATSQLGGTIDRIWRPDGLTVQLIIPSTRLLI
jgi:PAS domain S-box-containing protein